MTIRDYLVVDRFLQTQTDAEALRYALRSGLIDRLQVSRCSFDDLPVRTSAGRRLLADLLLSNDVLQTDGEHFELAPGFTAALPFRDLIEAKLKFGESISDDITHHFTDLIDDLPRFMAVSKTFQLFRYDRCFEATVENIEATSRWMELTTALTRYEGRVLADHLTFAPGETVLDVGGNSGELALQLCDRHPDIAVTVFDLPVVCHVGERHVHARGATARITFQPGDMRRDPLPAARDVVTMKSLLHDWPEADAAMLIAKAARALEPGGRLVIFERAPIRPKARLPYGQLSNLVFFPFFREADLYVETLARLGFEVTRETVELETAFHLIIGRRTPS